MKKKLCSGAKLLRKFGVVSTLLLLLLLLHLKLVMLAKMQTKTSECGGATAFVINERNANPPLPPPVMMMKRKNDEKYFN